MDEHNKIPKDEYKHRIIPSAAQVLSLCVVPIELICGEVVLARATAFVDFIDGRYYLITNWHSVTGRHPTSGRPLCVDGVTPDAVKVYHHRESTIKIAPGRFVVGFDFTNSDATYYPVEYRSKSSWFMHPCGQNVDIALLEIEQRTAGELVPISFVVNQFESRLYVTQEVFVLGFPMSLQPTGNLPVWKRGSIATEPALNAQAEPCFWIDSATRPGMSGSPVFVRSLTTPNGADQLRSHHVRELLAGQMGGFAFVGIYSGRMGKKYGLDSQLGKVWRPENIGEAISCPRPLDFDERSP